MKKILSALIVIAFSFFILTSAVTVLADLVVCNPNDPTKGDNYCRTEFDPESSCKSDPIEPASGTYYCQRDVFGKIQTPPALKGFLGTDTTGAAGISKFLTNLIALF